MMPENIEEKEIQPEKENNSENKKIVIHSGFYSALDDELICYEQSLDFSQIEDDQNICIVID